MGKNIYQLRSELEKELRENILPWWMEHTPDREHGGFAGEISGENRVVDRATKGSVLNARILWTFSAAHRMFGDAAYLDMARRAYDYIVDHFVDPEYGGVYWEVDHQGNQTNPRKQIYALAFAIYGMVEYYLASGENNALATAVSVFERIETHSLDKNRNGYFV